MKGQKLEAREACENKARELMTVSSSKRVHSSHPPLGTLCDSMLHDKDTRYGMVSVADAHTLLS